MDDQSFEFLLNNFVSLTDIISEECPIFALFKSVFRLQLLFIVFTSQAPKNKQLSNFPVFTSHQNRGNTEVLFSLLGNLGTSGSWKRDSS